MGIFDDVGKSIVNPTSYMHPWLAQYNLATGGGQPSGGNTFSPNYAAMAAERNKDMESGYAKGRELFYDNQDMKDIRAKREDLAKGYNGEQLGALRGQARNEVEGQRSNYLRSLAGKTARAGVGGARAAAMQASADKGFGQNRAELERKLTLDNANLINKNTESLQDFLLKQRFGELSTGLGYAQLGVSDRSAANQAAIAGQEQKKGPLGQLFDGLF